MTMTLFQRLSAWLELLMKREDLEFSVRDIQSGCQPFERYPADAKAFASEAQRLHFSYRLRPDSQKDDEDDVDGFLYLDLTGSQEPTYMLLDGKAVDEDDLFALDVDVDGVGLAAWFLLPAEGPPRLVWSVEDLVEFPSLTDYLTQGARRAFAYGGHPWQNAREAPPLTRRSVSLQTPAPELRSKLIARGATPAVADELLAWLGPDVALLIPQ